MKETRYKKSEGGNYHPASESWVGRDWWGLWPLERPHTSKGAATTQIQQFIAMRTNFMIFPRESRNRDFYMPTLTLVSKLIFKTYILCLYNTESQTNHLCRSWGPHSSLNPLAMSCRPLLEGFGRTLCLMTMLDLERILNTSLWKVFGQISTQSDLNVGGQKVI